MLTNLTYVTGNNFKFEVAQKAFVGSGVEIAQAKLDLPEIQSDSVEEIAAYSAKIAADKLGVSALVSDVGYYIPALNGFPGPFIKYINKWLSADELLRLMEGKTNRDIEVREALAYCEPGQEPVVFTGALKRQFSLTIGAPGRAPINQIFIPDGCGGRIESEIPQEELTSVWIKMSAHWEKLIEYLKTK